MFAPVEQVAITLSSEAPNNTEPLALLLLGCALIGASYGSRWFRSRSSDIRPSHDVERRLTPNLEPQQSHR